MAFRDTPFPLIGETWFQLCLDNRGSNEVKAETLEINVQNEIKYIDHPPFALIAKFPQAPNIWSHILVKIQFSDITLSPRIICTANQRFQTCFMSLEFCSSVDFYHLILKLCSLEKKKG